MKEAETWREFMVQHLASDPDGVKYYLQAIMEEYQTFGDTGVVLLALQRVAEAEGGIPALAKRINIDPEALSEELSCDKTLTIGTLRTILNTFGCRLSIEPLETEDEALETEELDHPTIYPPEAREMRIASSATAVSAKQGG